jgi:PRC-barrel domain
VQHHLTPLAALVSAAAIAVALTIAPVSPVAQHKQKPLAAKPSGSAVGLPVFSSDGRRIGMVVATGIDEDDQAVLVAEIERLVAMGSDAVAIPADIFVRKSDRIELTITAAEVSSMISKAGRER